jgi:hypothetical protein
MPSFIKRSIYKLARRKFVRGFDTFCTQKNGRALVYYKTEEFLLRGFLQDFLIQTTGRVLRWQQYSINSGMLLM